MFRCFSCCIDLNHDYDTEDTCRYLKYHVGVVKAVQHLLNEIGYVGTKVGDKADDPASVAMEMAPDEVQWLKVGLVYQSR